MSKKIVLFSRTSTTEQDVEQQTRVLIDEAKRLGYPVNRQIVIEYQESATKLDSMTRQGIQKLKETILSDNDVDCMLCWELTRLARRGDVIYDIRNFLMEHRIRLIILKPSFMELIDREGKVTPTMSLMLGIFTSFAESEVMIRKERFQRAKEQMTKEGKKSAGAVIFGYMKDRDKRCVPHPVHSRMIIDLFNYYINTKDASVYETFKYACMKYPDKFQMMNYHRAHRRMMHIFETEVYGRGNWCYPALIDEAMYDRIREKMSKAKCQPRMESRCQILGRGKVYCRYCGHMLTAVGGTVKAYNCNEKDEHHNVTINTQIVDDVIWDETRVIANINASVNNTTRISELQHEIEDKRTLIKSYRLQMDEINKKEEKLLDLYLASRIKRELYDARSSEVTRERLDIENNIISLENQVTSLEVILEQSQKDIVHQRTLNFDEIKSFEQRQELVRRYIDKVYVSKIEPRVYQLEFTYNSGIFIIQRGIYKYVGKNQCKKVYRINQDETEDRII